MHYHTLALDGVFTRSADGSLRFHPAAPPTDAEIARLLATIRTRILRLLARRGLDIGGNDRTAASVDPVADESPALAGLSSAAVQGRIALGPRAGARILQIGRDPNAPWVVSSGPRHAHLEGFDLHANQTVPAEDRPALERLARYILRPPIAQDRLQRTADGRFAVALKTAWSDGTTHLLFDPVELLAKLAVLTPRPRINLLLYHGILAPHARWRPGAVPHAHPDANGGATSASAALSEPVAALVPTDPVPSASPPSSSAGDAPSRPPGAIPTARHQPWASLMRRAFALDVLACPRCGGQMTLIATIEDPRIVRRILDHLGISTEIPQAQPSRAPPNPPDLFADFPT